MGEMEFSPTYVLRIFRQFPHSIHTGKVIYLIIGCPQLPKPAINLNYPISIYLTCQQIYGNNADYVYT